MTQQLDSIRLPYESLDSSSLLEQPTSVLLGVSQLAAGALNSVGISSVFDLASSVVFANAVDICLLANDGQGRFASTGRVPHDALREGHDKLIEDLPEQPIAILSTDSSKRAMNALAVAIDIASIRDLAAWPPYHTARQLLDRVYNPMSLSSSEDDETPADLVPSNGQFPTERVQYEVLLFDQFVGRSKESRTPRVLGTDGPIDVSQLLSENNGYERPAIGGILTFTQSWYTKGLSLGNLIHGIALAPGESTKIAMVDWSRRVRTSADESIQESEQLDSDLARARSISEITNAVAQETQRGDSAAHSAAVATEFGRATGSAGIRSPLDPSSYLGTAGGVETSGTSFGTSMGSTDATSWSTSSGQREIGAALAQDIVDRTHQASHSARNRRASIVREVSQSESETISTRTLTNYNHMHALTVEYYEVVQLYRTIVELSKADRCLFVPMKAIDFRNIALIDRYRAVLSRAALSPDVRDALQYPTGTTRIKAPAAMKPGSSLTRVADSPLADLSQDGWTAKDIREAQLATGGLARVLPDGRLTLPSDAVLYSIDFVTEDKAVKPDVLAISRIDGTSESVTYLEEGGWDITSNRPRLDEVAALTMTASGVTGSNKTGFVSVIFEFKGKGFRLVFPVRLEANVTLEVFYAATVPADVMSHLLDNTLYYSQAVWRALDPATVGILLSGYTWSTGGVEKPLVELVDPKPVAIVANYLVLRMSGDDANEHQSWLIRKRIKVGSRREDQVPVPSGGVFAEAVLGRFNSAEKLDITRFWNWQDSPIPIQAPDIAALQAGSRRDVDNTVPGQLSAPILNIVNPPSVPDPQGMGAILAAIQNGNMFRNMSGLAETLDLARAALAGAQQGATDASSQAGKNAEVAAQFGAKLAETAAKIVAAYFTGGASLAGGAAGMAGGISGQGAKINHGRDMDRRGVARPGNRTDEPVADDGLTPGGMTGDFPTDTGIESASNASTGTWEGDATNTSLGASPPSGPSLLDPVMGGGSTSSATGGRGGILGTVADILMGAAPGATRSPLVPFDPHNPSGQAQAAWSKMVAASPTAHQQRLDDYIARFGFDTTETPEVIRGEGIREPAQGILPADIEAVLGVATVLGTAPEHVLAVWIAEGKLVHDRMLRGETDLQGVDSTLLAAVDDAHKRAFARSLVLFKAFGSDAFIAMIPRGGPNGENLPLGVDANHDSAFDTKLALMRTAGVGGTSGKTNREIRDYFTLVGGGLRVVGYADSLEFGLRDDSVASWLWLQAGLFEVYRRDTEQQLGTIYGSAIDLSDRPWVTYLRWNGGPSAITQFLGNFANAEDAIDHRFGAVPDPIPLSQLDRYYGRASGGGQSAAALANSILVKYLVESVGAWFS